MNVTEKNGDVILTYVKDFNIAQTLDCGQCFRFEKLDGLPCAFRGVALGRALYISQEENEITLHKTTRKQFDETWRDYFSLKEDYSAIKNKISTDATVTAAIKAGGGIRILRQELWETVISFLISQNNNIPRIKKCIEAICSEYGSPIDEGLHAFPSPLQLACADEASLKALGLGYRNTYLCETTRKVRSGEFDLEELNSLATDKAREYLLTLKGVGGKVADCILLFGMHRYEVCPHDVWVKRIFSEHYAIKDVNEKKGYALASSKWGEYAGIAQQYLFYAERAGALEALQGDSAV